MSEKGNGLADLGIGVGSGTEKIKAESDFLRGSIVEELAQPTSHFGERNVQLLKFHGSYQQEDRDQRKARREQGLEKAFQFMIRSRVPGGVVTAEQYLAHDEIAAKYGNGALRLTTRQGFQIHGVLKENLRATIHEINATLLSTQSACGDVNRNVMACPAPYKDSLHEQISATAHRIAMHLAPHTAAYHEIWIDGEKQPLPKAPERRDEEPIYGPTYLPRKFKIGIVVAGDNCIDVYTQDIGLVAHFDGEEIEGYTVIVGGGLGMTHGKENTYPRAGTPLAFIAPDEVIEVVETIVKVQRDYGDRTNRKHARMKYVVQERGIAWFRGEVESRLGRALRDPRSIAWGGLQDHLGWHEQDAEHLFFGLYVENGRIKDNGPERMRSALRAVIERFKPDVRITAQQNILLAGIRKTDARAVDALFAGYGIVTDPERLGLLRDAMACPATPTCGLAVAEAERALPEVIRAIDTDVRELGLSGERIQVRMTGCPNGCARPYMGDIGFVGRSAGLYDIFLGGDAANTRLNAIYKTGVRLADLRGEVRRLLELWKSERNPGERFGDYCHRVGAEHLRFDHAAAAAI